MLCLVTGSRVNQQVFQCAGPLEHLVDRRHVIDPPAWCGAATTTLYGGRGDPLSSVGKHLSGKWDQGDRDCVHGRDFIAGSNTLRECFNNVDVGAPLWQSEPRDKFSRQEFASSHPSLKLSHFILQLMCLYFHRVVS